MPEKGTLPRVPNPGRRFPQGPLWGSPPKRSKRFPGRPAGPAGAPGARRRFRQRGGTPRCRWQGPCARRRFTAGPCPGGGNLAGPCVRRRLGRGRRAACWRSAECARRRFRIRLRDPPVGGSRARGCQHASFKHRGSPCWPCWREQGPYARRRIQNSRKRHPRRAGNPMYGGVSRSRPYRLSKAVYPPAYAVPRRGRRFSFPAHARFS